MQIQPRLADWLREIMKIPSEEVVEVTSTEVLTVDGRVVKINFKLPRGGKYSLRHVIYECVKNCGYVVFLKNKPSKSSIKIILGKVLHKYAKEQGVVIGNLRNFKVKSPEEKNVEIYVIRKLKRVVEIVYGDDGVTVERIQVKLRLLK